MTESAHALAETLLTWARSFDDRCQKLDDACARLEILINLRQPRWADRNGIRVSTDYVARKGKRR